MKRLLFSFLLFFYLVPAYSQWSMINTPHPGQNINYEAVHPNGSLIAANKYGEFFLSSDNGANWNQLSNLPFSITCLNVGPDGIIYCGKNSGYIYSTDLGLTWHEKQLASNPIMSILFSAPANIFLSESSFNSNCVWRSTDNGNTWTQISSGLSGKGINSLVKDTLGNVYCLTSLGEIYKLAPYDNSWSQIKVIPGADNLCIDKKNNLFTEEYSAIVKSTDLGITWFTIYNGYSYIVGSTDKGLYGLNYNSLIYSSDDGVTWINLEYTESNKLHQLIWFNNYFYAATDKGLLKTPDLINWEVCLRNNNKGVLVNDMVILPQGKIILASNHGIFSSSNNGNDWSSFHTANIKVIKKDNFGNIYAGGEHLFRSSDQGFTWSRCGFGEDIRDIYINDSGSVFLITIYYVFSSTDHGATWDTTGDFFNPLAGYLVGITQSSSGTLFICTYRLDPTAPPTEYKNLYKIENNIKSLVIYNTRFNNVFTVNDTLYLLRYGNGIYKSYDKGITLTAINNGLTNNQALQMKTTPEGNLLVLTDAGIFRSLNGGDYWARLDHSGITVHINNLYFSDQGKLYACTDSSIAIFNGDLPVELTSFTAEASVDKILLSWSTATELNNHGFEIQRSENKKDWTTIGFRKGNGTSTEPHSYSFMDNSFLNTNCKLFYKLKQVDFNGTFNNSEIVEVQVITDRFSLLQNYPNPFNNSTRIRWQIPLKSFVTVKVYDVLGKEVAVICKEEKNAGNYEVDFNANALASGIYYYQLRAGNYTETRKLLLIK